MAGDRLGTWAALTQGPAPRPLRRPGGQGAPPATPAPTPGSSGLEGAGLVPRTGGQHRRDRPGFPSRLAEGGRRPEFGTRPKGPAAIRSFSSRLLRPHFRPGVGSWGCRAAPADRPLQSVPLQQCLPGCPGLPEERPPPRPAGPGLAPGSAVLVITCLSSCAGPDRRGHRTGRGEQGRSSGWSGWGRGGRASPQSTCLQLSLPPPRLRLVRLLLQRGCKPLSLLPGPSPLPLRPRCFGDGGGRARLEAHGACSGVRTCDPWCHIPAPSPAHHARTGGDTEWGAKWGPGAQRRGTFPHPSVSHGWPAPAPAAAGAGGLGRGGDGPLPSPL